ncbi:16433_t:CDS:1, partial [Racocetra fulgida]
MTGKPVTSKAFTGEETNKAKLAPAKHTEEEAIKTKLPPPPAKSEGKLCTDDEAKGRVDPA